MYERVAVLDFGTARTKILVARRDAEHVSYETSCVENEISDAIGADASSASEMSRINQLLRSVEEAARRLRATTFRCIATDAFRAGGQFAAIASQIKARFGNLTILDPHTEARLFYHSVREIDGLEDYVAVDVGGGSVQIVWGEEPEKHLSMPIGTYRLQKDYQTLAGVFMESGRTDAKKMRQRILDELGALARYTPLLHGRTLVFGSNVMRNFFVSAFKKIGLNRPEGFVQREDLDTLFQSCAGRQYADLADYFPSNPRFMFGADKLLIVAAAVMDSLDARNAWATNASISKGLALAAL